MNHGSDSTYNNYRCRCAECRAAHREYQRRYRRVQFNWTPERERELYAPWLLENFPVALIARQAFPDDDVAIAAAFGATT